MPAKSGFPGTDSKAKGAVVFATGGERGVLRLWRSDTGQCVYEHRCGRLLCHGFAMHMASKSCMQPESTLRPFHQLCCC